MNLQVLGKEFFGLSSNPCRKEFSKVASNANNETWYGWWKKSCWLVEFGHISHYLQYKVLSINSIKSQLHLETTHPVYSLKDDMITHTHTQLFLLLLQNGSSRSSLLSISLPNQGSWICQLLRSAYRKCKVYLPGTCVYFWPNGIMNKHK